MAAIDVQPMVAVRRRRLSGVARVWLLTGSIAAASALVYLLFITRVEPLNSPMRLSWWSLAVLFCVAEVAIVHLQFRRQAYSFGLGEIPLVLGLIFAVPRELMLGQLVGIAAALVIYRRQTFLKVAFNLSHFALEGGLAILVFHALAGSGDRLGAAGVIAAFAAALVTAVVGNVAIAAAIFSSEGKCDLSILSRGLGIGTITTLTNASLGLVAATVLWSRPQDAWLLVIPAAILFLSYKAYTSQREKHESLKLLYEASRMLGRSVDTAVVLESVMTQARHMLVADHVEIILFGEEGSPTMRSAMGPDGRLQRMAPVELVSGEGIWGRILAEAEAVLLPRPIRNRKLHDYFAARGIRDVIAAPLFRDGAVVGMLMAANRMGEVGTFHADDLTLLETLTNHAGVALQNAQLVTKLEESLTELTEMNRLKDDFVATVSHELRSPLTAIQGAVKTMAHNRDRLSPEQTHFLIETADRQSAQLRELIEDLLTVSRIESGQFNPRVDSFDVTRTVRQAVEDIEAQSNSHYVAFEFEPGLPMVTNDEHKVAQIISNLVGNAFKYSLPETTVSVAACRDGDGVRIDVRDEGPGIPSEAQERIFERFFQVDQTSTKPYGGTGLGLYICRGLAESIGGRVALSSSGPQGSTFTLRLPVRIEEPQPMEEEALA